MLLIVAPLYETINEISACSGPSLLLEKPHKSCFPLTWWTPEEVLVAIILCQTDFDVVTHFGLFLNRCNSGAVLFWYKLKTMDTVAYLEHGERQSPITINLLESREYLYLRTGYTRECNLPCSAMQLFIRKALMKLHLNSNVVPP